MFGAQKKKLKINMEEEIAYARHYQDFLRGV